MFAPEVVYANFEEFLERHHGMVRLSGYDYAWTYMLVRLARDDMEKARRVFSWAVKRVCLNMLADPKKRFGPLAQEISTHGLHWAQRAEDTLGTNPAKSLSLVEGVFLLERLAVWAELNLHNRFGSDMSLVEFRQRPESNDEAAGKIAWIDEFYQQARSRAIKDTEEFVRRRDCAIGLSITSLAGKTLPSDSEIDLVLSQSFPTHQSLARQQREMTFVRGSLVNSKFVVEWVLGPEQADAAF
jgi:hypothetical protein